MKTKLTNLVLVAFLILLITSCKDNADVERAIETFFVFVIQVISFVLFGISSLVLSIIGASNKTNTAKIIGGILMGVFTLISVVCLFMIIEINPKRDYIYVAFLIDFIVIAISLFFLTKKKGASQLETGIITDKDLDQIIESKEENDIDELESI